MDLAVRFDLNVGLIHTLVSVFTGELLSAAEMLVIQSKRSDSLASSVIGFSMRFLGADLDHGMVLHLHVVA